MPVEYSGAAYRFGHSMIRAEYEVHDQHTVPIFANEGYQDLRGNRPVPEDLWIDWNYFFEIPGMSTPDDRHMARKIDTQLSLPLSTLPPTVVAPTAGAITSLAELNLLRGERLGLPAGQDVAVAMGLKPLTNQQLGLTDPGWKGKAPLWFYVLKEAELLGGHRVPVEEEPADGEADEDEVEDEVPHEEEPEVEEPEDDEEPELLQPGEAPDPAATSPVPGPVT